MKTCPKWVNYLIFFRINLNIIRFLLLRMYSKIFAILAASALVLSVIVMAQSTQPAKAQDKCFTQQSKDRTSTSTLCTTDSSLNTKELKKECKATTDNKETRCSSSQTGNGEFGNSFKP
jgi:hypothetical protein